jgi:hypothetical protein
MVVGVPILTIDSPNHADRDALGHVLGQGKITTRQLLISDLLPGVGVASTVVGA